MTEKADLTRRQFLMGGVAAGAGLLASRGLGSSPLLREERGAALPNAGGTLNVQYWSGITPASRWHSILTGFTQATGIKVNYQAEPSDYATIVEKLTTGLSSGYTGYDVLFLDDLMTATFAAAGWLLPLGGNLPKSDIAPLTKTHVDLSSLNSQLYRMPINQSFYVQFYRKDILANKGVSVPRTWSQLLSAGRELTKGGKYGVALAGVPADAFDDFLYFMPQAGGNFLNLELPGSQKALEFMHDLVSVYKVVPPSYATDSYNDIPNYVEEGYVSLWASWNGFMGGFVGNTKFWNGGKALAVASPAKGPVSDVTDVGDWGYSVSKYSTRQADAVKFISYASSKASQVNLAYTQSFPVRQDAVDASANILVAGNQFAQFLSKVNEVPRPITPETTLIQNNATPILVDYVAGKTSLKTAVKSAQAIINKYS